VDLNRIASLFLSASSWHFSPLRKTPPSPRPDFSSNTGGYYSWYIQRTSRYEESNFKRTLSLEFPTWRCRCKREVSGPLPNNTSGHRILNCSKTKQKHARVDFRPYALHLLHEVLPNLPVSSAVSPPISRSRARGCCQGLLPGAACLGTTAFSIRLATSLEQISQESQSCHAIAPGVDPTGLLSLGQMTLYSCGRCGCLRDSKGWTMVSKRTQLSLSQAIDSDRLQQHSISRPDSITFEKGQSLFQPLHRACVA